MIARLLSFLIYALSTVIGLAAFLYPFWFPSIAVAHGTSMAHAGDAPMLFTLLAGMCFVALLLEVQGQAVSTKFIALLGVLVSMNSLLRFIETAIPGPGGFSPILFLIILTGYVYGGRFGFQMGAMTLLVSALITGGVGPWLPYQMLTAGWVGMTAPLCRPLTRLVRGNNTWREVAVLVVFGCVWGIAYGAIMNIWFWPFVTGPADQYWQPGIGLGETLRRYMVFYLVTSFGWDIMLVASNTTMILAFGLPTLRALRRFQRRFDFRYQQQHADVVGTAATD